MRALHFSGLATLLLFLAAPSPAAADPGRHLFILSGQSNMAWLDADAFFTPLVAAEFGRERILVVKDAQGGQPIQRWLETPQRGIGNAGKKVGDLYQRLLRKVGRATHGQRLASVTLVWMQGENDARFGRSAAYGPALDSLVAQLQRDLGQREINVVIGRLSDYGLARGSAAHWQRIREIQVQFAESLPSAAWVDTDDLNDGMDRDGKRVANDLHYTATGYRVLGERFATRAIELVRRDGGGAQPAPQP
ncbi:sialate O-acetylesterase [Microbulbifer sediminum]|uniref:sialate O-acetylesterase n=1 Tax=Microbulbifer sediminum TaxID=2904250 RepID=UPI001F1B7691|nr:sialate O-acetylesterase [Microbulbifer sediminum]